MLLSSSRIYIFGVEYQGENYLTILQANELSGLIANILKAAMPEFLYKNIQIINKYEEDEFTCELHINKIKYKERRVLSKEASRELYRNLRKQLKKINGFKFAQLHSVNDEFSREPSVGYLTEQMFYI